MNILFIGLGRISQRYIRLLKKFHNKEFKNIYVIRHTKNSVVINDDLSSFKVKDINKYYNILPTSLAKIKELNIDVAFIVNAPSKIRFSLIKTLIEKKIHIFCEKPILPYFDNEKNIKIKKLLVANKIIFFSAFQLRYHPFFKNIKNIIKSKKYGNLKFLKMEITESFHLFNKYTNLKNSHYVDKNIGGGVLLAQCHEIDILHFLFDNINLTKVVSPKKTFLKNLNVEMLVSTLFIGSQSKNNFPIQLNMDMVNPLPKREGVFYFDNYMIFYNLRENYSLLYDFKKNKSIKTIYNFERIELFKEEISSFLSLIKKKKIDYANFNDGLKSLKTIASIKKKL
ncbi:Gfo/Idh/MocA family oxidoreductase [Alphaproteobacteria bacterium]|nr:Gfo/Idh/MocA family oxidoreductase [Alphaproteobacteria bacterium]